jgi:hypothetical protein
MYRRAHEKFQPALLKLFLDAVRFADHECATPLDFEARPLTAGQIGGSIFSTSGFRIQK